MRADSGMFYLYRERVLSVLSAEWLLTRILVSLICTWMQQMQLFLLRFHINSEVDKSVQSNITCGQSLD